jgi:hypothetical protein
MKTLIFILLTIPVWGQQDTIPAFSIKLGENTKERLQTLQVQIIEANNEMNKIIDVLKESKDIPFKKYMWRWRDEKMEEIVIIEKQNK